MNAIIRSVIEPLDLITRLSELHPEIRQRRFSCARVHLLLKAIYAGHGYYDGDHIVTKINDKFYDIDGLVDAEGFLPMSDYGREYFMGAFREFDRVGELCPHSQSNAKP